MKKKILTGLQNSGTNTQLRQVLSHLQIASSAEDDPTCQACGERLLHADPVTLYLSRPVGRSGYTVGQCRCNDHNDDLTSLFTLGIRELVVDGRIGECHDRASQQTWPVLLAPSLRVVSAADTKTGRFMISQIDTTTTGSKGSIPIQEPDIGTTNSEQIVLTPETATQPVGGRP